MDQMTTAPQPALEAAAEAICRMACPLTICKQQCKCTHGNLQATMIWQEAEIAIAAYEAAQPQETPETAIEGWGPTTTSERPPPSNTKGRLAVAPSQAVPEVIGFDVASGEDETVVMVREGDKVRLATEAEAQAFFASQASQAAPEVDGLIKRLREHLTMSQFATVSSLVDDMNMQRKDAADALTAERLRAEKAERIAFFAKAVARLADGGTAQASAIRALRQVLAEEAALPPTAPMTDGAADSPKRIAP